MRNERRSVSSAPREATAWVCAVLHPVEEHRGECDQKRGEDERACDCGCRKRAERGWTTAEITPPTSSKRTVKIA